MNISEQVKTVIHALEDKKADRVQVIEIGEISSVADYFIIANGTNINQVQAMADNVDEALSKVHVHARAIEGYNHGNWILLDYQDFVVHVFDKESRGFYDLERIWRDGKIMSSEEFLANM